MKTVRDLVERAYKASKVLGNGMDLSGSYLNDGLDILKVILLEEFAESIPMSTKSLAVSFNGSRDYTIGTGDITDAQNNVISPDILVSVIPESIDQIIIKLSGDIRSLCLPMNAQMYYARCSDIDITRQPAYFYFERQGYSATSFPVIHFIGNPSDNGELIYTPALSEIDSNTKLDTLPKTIIPYLNHELAYRAADENGLDAMRIKVMANRAKRLYISSSTPETPYLSDQSYISTATDQRYDYSRGRRQILGGRQ